MKLDRRMRKLLSEIPDGKNLADIGADHGYISICYALNNPNSLVVASDISSKSIAKAKLTAEKLGLCNYKTEVGDGLCSVENYNIDCVLISGMGGEEIIKIINKSKRYPLYILSPQKNTDKVRQFLSENNLSPKKDYKVLSENKFYDILICENGKYNPTDFELLFGSGIGDDFKLYAKNTYAQLNEIYPLVGDSEKNIIAHKLQLLKEFCDD